MINAGFVEPALYLHFNISYQAINIHNSDGVANQIINKSINEMIDINNYRSSSWGYDRITHGKATP